MAVIRGFAATALLACLVVSAAGPAWAKTPTMSGDYTETSTAPDGHAISSDWSVHTCGDGCLWIAAGSGSGQAHFIDGQWVMDTMTSLYCQDGSYVKYAANSHLTWDPNTLVGTSQITYNLPACGKDAGFTQTNNIKIEQPS
jgi:hypothetical protein